MSPRPSLPPPMVLWKASLDSPSKREALSNWLRFQKTFRNTDGSEQRRGQRERIEKLRDADPLEFDRLRRQAFDSRLSQWTNISATVIRQPGQSPCSVPRQLEQNPPPVMSEVFSRQASGTCG
jgi:hypothetical protein